MRFPHFPREIQLHSRIPVGNEKCGKLTTLHPGAVNTEITRYHKAGLGSIFTTLADNGLRCFGKTPREGAQTTIFCCVDENLKKNPEQNGEYFVDCKKVDLFPWLIDDRKQKLLWDLSKKFVKID